jgi:hypothetical protein
MKDDREGDQDAYGRHLYCNPYNSMVWPISVLSVYLIVFRMVLSDPSGCLIPGDDQAGRYYVLIDHLKQRLKTEIEADSIHIYVIGTHSLQKIGLAFLLSGPTAGPSETAVKTRADCSSDGQADRYLHYECTGDTYDGRIFCGLDNNSPYFAVLPPMLKRHLSMGQDGIVGDLFESIFRTKSFEEIEELSATMCHVAP